MKWLALALCVVFFGCSSSKEDIYELRRDNQDLRTALHNIYGEMGLLRSQIDVLRNEVAGSKPAPRATPASDYVWPSYRVDTAGRSSSTPSEHPGIPAAQPASPRTIEDSNAPVGTTRSGATIYEGPRGGHYHYSPSGKKVYEKKRK